MDINMFLKENRIESINHEVLQNILEKTIASTKRESIGQFTTPQELADILVRITTLNWREEALDPCCGSGTIAKAILENKIKKLNNLESAKASVWAADKFSFPLQIANLSMTDGDSMNLLNKVFKKNVFDLHVQPANKKSRVNYGLLKVLYRSKTRYQNKTARNVGLKKDIK